MTPLLIILTAWLAAAIVYVETRSIFAATGTVLLCLGIAVTWRKWSLRKNR